MIRECFNTGWKTGIVSAMIPPFKSSQVSKKVTLPYDCMQDEIRTADAPSSSFSGYYPAVTGSYTKYFDVPAEWEDKYVVLDFEGVYMNAAVFINDDYAGGAKNGYTEFYVEANKYLKYSEKNKITVSFTTAEDSRWYTGAGIYRNVNILVSDLTHIVPDSYRISTPEIDDDGTKVTLDFSVRNLSHKNAETYAETTIKDQDGIVVGQICTKVTAFAHETQKCHQSIYLENPRRWNMDDPYLYQISTRIISNEKVLDEEEAHFGVRTLQLDPKHGLRINGKTVKLRGACIHHDNGLLGAASIDRAEERRIELLKAAGFNAIRSAHNPVSKAILDACDRNGIVVMDELFDVWTRSKTVRDTASDFYMIKEQMCESMVAKDYNHPSVIMYSIGNEIQETGTAAGAKIGRDLVEKLRSMDRTRYVLNSINVTLSIMNMLMNMQQPNADEAQEEADGQINSFMTNLGDMMSQLTGSEMVTEATRESFDCLDICGYNYATIRYGIDAGLFPNRVLVGSETFPAEIAANWAEIKKYPQAIGDFTWTGMDYLGEAGIAKVEYSEDGEDSGFAGAFPWLIGNSGDLDILGDRRPISYYREIVYGLTDKPAIGVEYPWNYGKTHKPGKWEFIDGICSWSFRGYENRPIRVHVFGNGDRFELYVNDKLSADGKLEMMRGAADVTYEPGIIRAVVYRDGEAVGESCLVSAKDSLHLEANQDRKQIKAADSDLCYVGISACDEDGIVDNMAEYRVSVRIEGCGELLALGSARPVTEEVYTSGHCTAFNGKAMAVIRPTSKGKIRVIVSADKYQPAETVIVAE